MSKLRAALRRVTPTKAKRLLKDLRSAIGEVPIDEAVLSQYAFQSDQSSKPRLSFVVPNLSDEAAFGGVTTGIDVQLNLTRAIAATHKIDLRLILTDHDQSTNTRIFTDRAAAMGFAQEDISVHKVENATASIAVRRHEIFTTFNWWTTLNIEPLLMAQAEHFDAPPKPLLYLIQEYEPAFYPLSSGHMLAREAYDTPRRLWAVFNSSNLRTYFERQDHSVEKGWVLEPVINDKLRPYLAQVAEAKRKPQIFVYGRPNVDRNCWPALIRGLKQWVRDHPEHAHWEVISAGTPHKPVDLGDGRMLRSLGKMPLDGYAQTLLESSVGVSLMASPHPSYPPLEMAHFGIQLVTNSYTCKDLADYHPNIISLSSISAKSLAGGIAKACEASATGPFSSQNPLFVREENYPFMSDLAEAVRQELL